MIRIDNNGIIISGELSVLLTEFTTALRRIYFEMVADLGEEEANQYLVKIGRLAVISDDDLANAESTDFLN